MTPSVRLSPNYYTRIAFMDVPRPERQAQSTPWRIWSEARQIGPTYVDPIGVRDWTALSSIDPQTARRLESFCVLVVGVLLSRTVNLSHLACMFPTQAEIASNYRRLQRFFEQVILDGSQLARVIVRIVGLGTGPWLLALDRTCWKFGRYDINVLMLAIIHNGIAIPVMWDVLGRAGTSTTAQRSALLSRFCAVFGETAIAGLIADREFIGRAWMTSLAERDIPFILRIKDTFHVRLADGRQCQVRSLFRKVGVGGRRYIRENCRLGSRDSSLGPPLKLAAMRLVSGDLLVVATNTDPKSALAHYRRRWEIETLFAATKTRGFNFEDTHLIHPDRIGKLLAVLAVAFAFAHATGEWQAKHRSCPTGWCRSAGPREGPRVIRRPRRTA